MIFVLLLAVVHADVTGYVSDRLQGTGVRTDTSLPTRDLPKWQNLLELNAQIKKTLGSDLHFAYADLSLFSQQGGGYITDDGAGPHSVPDHNVAALHPFAVPSELYISSTPDEHLNLLFGRKRIVWGSGLAWNPADVLNPAKDPTDPTLQRAGAWMARAESVFEDFTITALVAPQVTEQVSGLPTHFLAYPSWDAQDGHAHFLAAARLYALWNQTDINLVYYFTNNFNDDIQHRSRVALSFSRYFFTDYELHAEALLARGSTRLYPCDNLFACAAPFGEFKRDDGALYPRVLLGTRTLFSDESQLSIEYLYQADGFKRSEMATLLSLLKRAHDNQISIANMSGDSSAAPQKFSFTPLRRHYAFISFQRPKIADDWTASAFLLADLEDFSGLATLSLAWSATEWLTLTAVDFIPFPGKDRVSEGSLLPFDNRVLFEARVFY